MINVVAPLELTYFQGQDLLLLSGLRLQQINFKVKDVILSGLRLRDKHSKANREVVRCPLFFVCFFLSVARNDYSPKLFGFPGRFNFGANSFRRILLVSICTKRLSFRSKSMIISMTSSIIFMIPIMCFALLNC
jgi:hypothetical protein